ncbi:hypothetical protein, partial [Pseudomonas sp. P179]|uniref:hypothetical protein n=1 Tax=Pseudomonas sp. P179 TaxID=1125698 RepID=UPI001C43A2DB
HGSERASPAPRGFAPFLSCLHGSEREFLPDDVGGEFLSCLHGSELAPKTYNHLKEKEIPSFSRQKPSFFEVS